MRQLENCRCLALAILIVVGWHAESRASVEAEQMGTAPPKQQSLTDPIGYGSTEVKGVRPSE